MSELPFIETNRPRHLSQGDFACGGIGDPSITTILGSCVATCLWDPVARVGGMNHFLVPEGASGSHTSASFGVNAMELLINALAKIGADRRRLRAKVFGGARMIAGLTDVGSHNATFVKEFLSLEGIPLDGESLGGTQARRVEFWSANGRARQMLVGETPILVRPVTLVAVPSEVELF